jgi:predicted O-methyltransferase YrrM
MDEQLKIIEQIPTAWTDHIKFAQWIVNKQKPQTIVDLGVAFGYSSFCFALPKVGKVYGIDTFEGDSMSGYNNTFDYVKQKRKELNLDNVIFIKGYFGIVAKKWKKTIDILHIDGFHSYTAVKNDYDTWSKFVHDDGLILFHDTCVPHYGVHEFFNEISLPKTNFTCSHGLGVVSKNSNLIDQIKKTFALDD